MAGTISLFNIKAASLQFGRKSTISNLAAAASKQITRTIEASVQRDAYLPARAAQVFSPGNGVFSASSNVQTYDPYAHMTSPGNQRAGAQMGIDLFDFQSKRIYGNEEERNGFREIDGGALDASQDIDAGFVVDSNVGDTSEDDELTRNNLQQAAQIKNQMGLKSADQNLESLARDLAVFGLDFTVFESDNPEALVETIRDRTLSMLDKSAENGINIMDRNRITGASARLVNGIQSAAGAFFRVDGTTEVDVGGKTINGDAAYDVGSVVIDPLVLDLAGDGINLSSAEDGVSFDMDGDGEKTRMGFIQGDDAFLFADENGDGVANDGRELFGNTDGHANGYEKLARHDDNGDGVIDKNDKIWNSLRVWTEKTADGVSTSDETMSLDEAGIESLDVSYKDVRIDDGTGNLLGQTGGFKRTDGTTGMSADAWLRQLGAGYSRPE